MAGTEWRDEDDLLFYEEGDDELQFEPDDEDLFAEEAPLPDKETDAWKILIVDDEIEVHQVTKMVLSDIEFEDKHIRFFSAYSANEAQQIMQEEQDIALMLLDVVMENEEAGLRLVQYIREEAENQAIRIILRTGQPGQAPEQTVIKEYDINDYKEKTELTSQKLFTAVISALRSYQDIKTIERNKIGLEKIIEASADIFKLQSMKTFAGRVLTQFTSLLSMNRSSLHCSSMALTKEKDRINILAATGAYVAYECKKTDEVLPGDIQQKIHDTFHHKQNTYFVDQIIIYHQAETGTEYVIYINGIDELTDVDKNLIEIYSANISIAFDNINLNQEIENTQKDVIYQIGEIVEARSKETSAHIKRVAAYSRLLGLLCGMTEEEAELLALASPMHDIGKIGIPDAILNKKDKLTTDEYELMKTHTTVGYNMLKYSDRPLLKASALIAHQHHEKYNGTGYPRQLKGEDIHIYGRIVAVADVFDALASDRPYKEAWEMPKIKEWLLQERGEQFDPQLVDLFLANLDEFLKIKAKYDC